MGYISIYKINKGLSEKEKKTDSNGRNKRLEDIKSQSHAF